MKVRFVKVLVTSRIKLTTNSWVGKPLCGGSFQIIRGVCIMVVHRVNEDEVRFFGSPPKVYCLIFSYDLHLINAQRATNSIKLNRKYHYMGK